MLEKIKCQISFFMEETFLQQIPHAAILLNQRGAIVKVNNLMLRASGYEWEQLSGNPFQMIIDSTDDIETFFHKMKRMAEEEQKLPQVTWIHCTGKRQKSELILFPGKRGEERFYCLCLTSISPHLLIPLKQRFIQQLTTDINLGIIVVDAEGRIVEISEMACLILGVHKQEILNKSLDEVFQGVPEEQRVFQKSILNGVVFKNQAISWTNDNQRYELLVDSNILRDELGNLVGAYVVFKDVTNLRSLEQKIQRSDRLAMIGQIAAGTAHEIRNPLTSIKGFLQILRQSLQEKGLEKEKEYTEIMLTEIKRINTLVSEFLLLSKPRDIQYQLVDLNHVLREILPIVENEALLHGIDVEYRCDDRLPMVIGDSELLKQVFLNISKNGIEAMGDSGKLTISYHLDEKEKKVSIDIHDTGPGIPPYVIDKIFDPFFTTKEEGTGLGLSVCQKIIHDIGGQIRISTKGYGTTFHIIIPCSL
ncbi:hypothetical protein BSNK01_23160 [Bacillaceae bacterium]